jgi:hypothetical protein
MDLSYSVRFQSQLQQLTRTFPDAYHGRNLLIRSQVSDGSLIDYEDISITVYAQWWLTVKSQER